MKALTKFIRALKKESIFILDSPETRESIKIIYETQGWYTIHYHNIDYSIVLLETKLLDVANIFRKFSSDKNILLHNILLDYFGKRLTILC